LDAVKNGLTKYQSDLIDKDLKIISSWASSINLVPPRKVLVTGASGFIGQWIFAALLEIAREDNTITIRCESGRFNEIQQIWFPNDSTRYNEFSADERFDLIFDLSLPPTGPSSQEQVTQAETFYANLVKNFRRISSGGRVIHPSSGAVYGNLRYSNNLCEDLKVTPSDLSIYGEAKLGIEDLVGAFSQNDMDLITPRVFSVFGPLMREDSPLVGNTFIREASKRKDISARKSAGVYRDFAYITDLVKQILYIGVNGSAIKNINLGSNNVVEISEFGAIISNLAEVNFNPGESSEKTDRYFGCLHHLNRISIFKNAEYVPLTEAIQKSLDFYRSNL
jgi:nucleoside-diphosphate-sugar epimerase